MGGTGATGGSSGAGGVGISLSDSSLSNTGTIEGGVDQNDIHADGVDIGGGGMIVNGSPGFHAATVSGFNGVKDTGGGAVTVTNFGTITGIYGAAVSFASASDRLVVESGAVFNGSVSGGGGSLEFATYRLFRPGNYSGFGVYQIDGGVNLNESPVMTIGGGNATALIVDGGLGPAGAGFYDAGVTGLAVDGPATVSGLGRVDGGEGGYSNVQTKSGAQGGEGIYVAASAALTAGATITGGGGGRNNAYGLSGAGGVGVVLTNDASLTANGLISGGGGGRANGGPIADGQAGAGGEGVVLGAGASLIASGTITGGAGGRAYLGAAAGAGGAGVYLGAGASGTNSGTTNGGEGGYSFATAGGAGGAGAILSGADLTNTGTIDGGATSTSTGTLGGGVDMSGGSLINGDGTHDAATISGLFGVSVTGAGTVTNFGTIDGTGGGAVTFASSAGRLIIEAGSVFIGQAVGGGGTLELAGGNDTDTGQGGTVTLAGGVSGAFSGFGAVVVDAGASLDLVAGHSLTVTDTLDLSGTLSGAGVVNLVQGSLTVATGGIIDAKGGGALQLAAGSAAPPATIVSDGLIEATGAGALGLTNLTVENQAGGAVAIHGKGRIDLFGAQILGGSLSIEKGASLLARAGQDTVDLQGGTVVNAGVIEAGRSGALEIKGALVNTGIIEGLDDTLAIDGNVTGAGQAIVNGGTLTLGGAFSDTVSFSAAKGELVLAQSAGYAGTIRGFSKTTQSTLDLQDIAFAKATESYKGTAGGGVLTVTDGTHTARLRLVGDYTGSTFALAADSGTGTLVTDPPSPAHFASAMAGMAPAAGMSAAASPTPTALAHPLLATGQ